MRNKILRNKVTAELLSNHKRIDDSLYYDTEKGSKFFETLIRHPDYYPFRTETEILEKVKKDLPDIFKQKVTIIDIGSGDGSKTFNLAKEFYNKNKLSEYIAIDISSKYLDSIEKEFGKILPAKMIKTINSDYFEVINSLKSHHNPFLFLFLGNNFGNMDKNTQEKFLNTLSNIMAKEDLFLIGIDIKKDKETLDKAYYKTCESWCYYLIDRINDILSVNLNKKDFEYITEYNEDSREYMWFLIPNKNLRIKIPESDNEIFFAKNEKIDIGRSFKFDLDNFYSLAEKSNLKIVKVYQDNNKYYADVLLNRL